MSGETSKLLGFVRRFWKPLLGIVLGAGAGAGYSWIVGCFGGS